MESAQAILLKIPEQPEADLAARPAVGEKRARAAKLKPIDREQGLLRPVIVEELVGPDHKVRAIWDLTGELDLSGFLRSIRSREGQAGGPAWNPRLLLSIWVYSYSEQVSSAREIARLMEYEPGLMWLSGLGEVNYHTLADFRAEHAEELKGLLAELLGMLSKEGVVKLELVAHDGTKVRAQAGADTFRREATLERETAKARQMIEELELEREEQAEGTVRTRREAARERAGRERTVRMKLAAEQLRQIRESKSGAQEKAEARVSLSEPEARVMKHGDGALAPSYNVQLSTDAEQKVIVGVGVRQASSDGGLLASAVDQVRATTGRYPAQVVADGGFTNQGSIAAMQQRGVELYGSLSTVEARQAGAMKAAGIDPAFGPQAFRHQAENRTLQCPAGKFLEYVGQSRKRGESYQQYQGAIGDCQACAFQKRCCPPGKPTRLISMRTSENAEVAAFRAKMDSPEAKQIYRRRGPTAEFPNCWIKEKLGLRKFRLRGLVKAGTEALWAVVSYDVLQWFRLCWKVKRAAPAV